MRALFVGLGSIGQRHLRNLCALCAETGAATELLAWRQTRSAPVLDGRGGVLPGTLAARYGLRELDTLEEALAARPDVVFVTGPSSQHVPVALAAARAGAHLFVEKPLATAAEGLDELLAVVAERRLVAAVGFQLRFDPALQQVAAWLEAGRIGALASAHLINGEYLPDMHPWEDYRLGYAARRELGGGSIHTQCHDLDLVRWLFGQPRRVFAVGGRRSALEVDVEDVASLLLECPGGLPVTVQLDYLRRPPQRGATIVGDAGRIVWDHHARSATVTPRDGEPDEARFAQLERNELFVAELREFLDAVAGRGAPRVSLADGADVARLALAAHRSLATGAAVELSRG